MAVELLGQGAVLKPLLEAASNGRLHHCYLFEGPEGVGKHAAAVQLAMAAACTGDVAPCESCQSCRHMARGTHPDLVEIGLDPDRKTPTISARQAREVVSQARLQRFSARRRTFVIDPADRLGPEGANALLKTLEEPPNGTGFILVTSRVSALLPTVISRSQRVRFSILEEGALRGWLEDKGISEAGRIAAMAQGRPGRALALANGELAALDQARAEMLEVLGSGPGELFAYAKDLASGGSRMSWLPKVERLFLVLESLVRDAMAVGAGANLGTLNRDQQERVNRWATALWPGGGERIQRAMGDAREQLDRNVSGRLVVETLLSHVATELGRTRREG
jgi:DNA polymerase-3 subunit delta'